GTTSYYYYDWITWLVVVIVLLWLTLVFIRRYRHARALRRPPPRANYRMLKRISKIKRRLGQQYLQPGFSETIHAVGIGRAGDDYCIQVFVSDANREWSIGSGTTSLPATYGGIPLIMIEMSPSVFTSAVDCDSAVLPRLYPNGIRERQDVLLAALSGANT